MFWSANIGRQYTVIIAGFFLKKKDHNHCRVCILLFFRKHKVPRIVMSSSPSTRFDGSDIDGTCGGWG